MKEINGFKLTKLDFIPLKLGDFLYHEGSLLSHFIDELNPNIQYLYKWTDCDEVCNRWMIIKLSETLLLRFFCKEVSLRDIVFQSPYVIFVDIDDYLVEKQIIIAPIENVYSGYLPSAQSFFDEEQYEKYAINLRDKIILNERDTKFEKVYEELSTIKNQQQINNQLLNVLLQFLNTKQSEKLDIPIEV